MEWEEGLWVLLRHLVLKCLECFGWRSWKGVRNGLCVNPYTWKLLFWGLTSWGLTVIVINSLFIELPAAGNIKCLVRLEMPEEDSSGKMLHGQSIKHMNKCYLLTAKNCAQGFAGLQHGCLFWDPGIPSFSGAWACLAPHPIGEALGFGKSQRAEMGEVVKGNTRRSVTPGLRRVRVSLSRRWGKESVCGMALVHSWKEMEGIAYNSKMTVFNKYFALYLQKGRGCHIAEQEVCCYNTVFWESQVVN